MIDFSYEGANDLNDMLADLQSILGKKAARTAARNSMKPVLNEVKRTAPIDDLPDGIHLNESFKLSVTGRTKSMTKKNSDTFLMAKVQTSGKEVEKYAALIEYGRKEYTVQRTNVYGITTDQPYMAHVGSAKPNPFMRTALYTQGQDVVNNFTTDLHNEINKIKNNKSRIAKSKIKCKERKAKKLMK